MIGCAAAFANQSEAPLRLNADASKMLF